MISLALTLDVCDKMLERVFTAIGATHIHRTRSPAALSYAGLLSVESQNIEVIVTEPAPGQCQLQFSSRAAAGAQEAPGDPGARVQEIFERALKRQAGPAMKA
jgi:hypothetical protein